MFALLKYFFLLLLKTNEHTIGLQRSGRRITASVYERFYLGIVFYTLFCLIFPEFRVPGSGQSFFPTKHCFTINLALFNLAVKSVDTPLNTIERLRLSIEFHTCLRAGPSLVT